MAAGRLGPRRSDVAVTTVLAALGVYIMLENSRVTDAAVRVDSPSWLQQPLYLAAVAPLLFWRRGPVRAVAAATVAMGLHVLVFGWAVRCGAGLPLTWAFAYLVGTRDDRRHSLVSLVVVQVLGFLVLVRDSAAGVDIYPLVAAITVGVWAIGRVARQRTQLAEELTRRTEELRVLRDQRARLEVEDDRVRMSAELDALLHERLTQLSRAAKAAPAGDPETTRRLMAGIEEEGRRTLTQMREIVGVLRRDEPGLAPVPSVASIEALLARRGDSRAGLVVTGDPRTVPASVELTAYRIVEHLLGVLSDEPSSRVEVTVCFDDDALEIRVAGPVSRGADVRGAVARARERARLQEGRLDVRVVRGRARAVAQVPLVPV